MKEAVVRAVANLLGTIIIAISIFIGFGMLWEQDQLDYEQREKHHEEQKTLMSALIAVISDQSGESYSEDFAGFSSPEIITTPGTIQNAPPNQQLSRMRHRSSDVQQVGVAVAAFIA